MQLRAAAGAPGSAAPAGCSRPGRPPRHHNRGWGVGWRPRIGGPSARRPGWRGCPCGPAAPRPQPRAARSARRRPLTLPCAPAARGAGPSARRPARQSEPSAAAACPPPARCALHAARRRRLFLPSAGAVRCSSQLRRSAISGFATSASARCGSGGAGNRAAPETGGGAPGAWVPGPLPTPSAARAGPRAGDAPPRGTVRTAGRPPALPRLVRAKGDLPLPGSPTRLEPQKAKQNQLCLCLPTLLARSTPSAQALGTGNPTSYNSPLLCAIESGVGKKRLNRNILVNRGT